MPLIMSKYAKLFRNLGNNLTRDFYEIISVSKKNKFVKQAVFKANDMIAEEKEKIRYMFVEESEYDISELHEENHELDEELDNKLDNENNIEEDKMLEGEIDTNEHDIFIDGINNFKHGIPIFCCSFIFKEDMMFFEPITGNYYWGNKDEFFINDIRCKAIPEEVIESVNDNIIPDSFKIMWYLSGAIQKPVLQNPDQFVSLGI